jgi:nickel/cobalt transporter (NicO) family protein
MRRVLRRLVARAATTRVLLAAAAAVALAFALLALAAPAGAHPLGNFSVNHLTVVRASSDRVDVRYVLDQAEIPTFRERGLPAARVLERKRAEVARGLSVAIGGRPVTLTLRPGGRLTFPRGAGGLRTTRVELLLSARVASRGAVVVRDATFAGRVGWRAVLAEPGRGTAVRSDVTSADPTRRLRVYPTALLASPANATVAHLRVSPGAGTVTAPRGDGGGGTTTTDRGAGDRFGSVFERAAAGRGVLLLLLLAAFGWGAVHALSPGHGKAMVAAYLVGARGTARHAVALGLTVTVTHTIGVFALGAVALALSSYVLPEDLYPWLNLVSGLLVLGVGASGGGGGGGAW